MAMKKIIGIILMLPVLGMFILLVYAKAEQNGFPPFTERDLIAYTILIIIWVSFFYGLHLLTSNKDK